VASLLQLLDLAKENAALRLELRRMQEQLALLQRKLDEALSTFAHLHGEVDRDREK
jgi:hypothetical protein